MYGACSNIHDMYQSTRLRDAQLDASDPNGKIIFSADGGANWTTLHSFGHPVFWLAIDPIMQNGCTLPSSILEGHKARSLGVFILQIICRPEPVRSGPKLSNPPRTEDILPASGF